MMSNFLCQLDWPWGVPRLNLILGLSVMAFPAKETDLSVWVGLRQLPVAGKEHRKEEEEESACLRPYCLGWGS